MPIPVVCSSCSAKMTAPDRAAGRQAKCPKCGMFIDVPRQWNVISHSQVAEPEPKRVEQESLLQPCPDCKMDVSCRASQCPHCGCPLTTIEPETTPGPGPTAAFGKLVIMRSSTLASARDAVQVFVDGQPTGQIMNGATLTLDLPVGQRSVRVTDGFMSRTETVDIVDGKAITYQMYFSNWGFWGGGLNFRCATTPVRPPEPVGPNQKGMLIAPVNAVNSSSETPALNTKMHKAQGIWADFQYAFPFLSSKRRAYTWLVASVVVFITLMLLYSFLRPQSEEELRRSLVANVPPGWHSIGVHDNIYLPERDVDICFTSGLVTYHYSFVLGNSSKEISVIVRHLGVRTHAFDQDDMLVGATYYQDGGIKRSEPLTSGTPHQALVLSFKGQEIAKLLARLR